MKVCKCGASMQLLFVWDDAQQTDHAFNVYGCDPCGRVLKEDVWENKGQIWLGLEGLELSEEMKMADKKENEEKLRRVMMKLEFTVVDQAAVPNTILAGDIWCGDVEFASSIPLDVGVTYALEKFFLDFNEKTRKEIVERIISDRDKRAGGAGAETPSEVEEQSEPAEQDDGDEGAKQ